MLGCRKALAFQMPSENGENWEEDERDKECEACGEPAYYCRCEEE